MTKVRAATTDDLDRSGLVLARAFQDDPGAIVFEPDASRRAAFLPQFFRSFVAASLSDGGEVLVPVPGVDGIAIRFGPAMHGPTIGALLANGFGDALQGLGEEGTQRLTAMVESLDAAHRRLTSERSHLRLVFFGVDPEAQGRGIGWSFLNASHGGADELGLPTYLETFTTANVRFYEKRGYTLVDTFAVDDAVPVYAMERAPLVPGPA